MKNIYILGLAVVAASSLAAPSTQADEVATRYRIAMEMRAGDKLVGEPSMIVEEGKPARVEIEPGDGSFYHATLLLNQEGRNRIGVLSDFNISSPRTGEVRALPDLKLVPGRPAEITLGEGADGKPAFIARVTVSKVGS